tara:strand:- start:1911 stop:2234 length:324 start_codon:yes stop_codon:yes gene_type:complete
MYTNDLIEISLQSNDNLDMLLEIIKDKVLSQEDLKTHVFALLCELVWINSNVLFVLRRDLQELIFKEPDQKEVIIPEQTLAVLTTLMIARQQATVDLNRFSYSLSLH